MTLFEFVFGLISIVTSLALANLVSGVISLLRNDARFSWRHAGWTWASFALLIGNWAGYWTRRDVVEWSTHAILTSLAYMIVLYGFCTLVIPEMDRREKVDLVAFHEAEGRRYIATHALFAALTVGVNFGLSGFNELTIRNTSLAMVGLTLSGVAYFARPVWVQAAAALSLAAMTTFFMVMQMRLLGS